MNYVATFYNASNQEINWEDIQNHPEWKAMPDDWSEWKESNPSEKINTDDGVLLFRTHQYHQNPDLRSQQGDKIVHASCRPVIPHASAISRYDGRKVYGGLERFAFVSIYKAQAGQTFYVDEDLEMADQPSVIGTPIEEITKFEPDGPHFETDAIDCEEAGLYLVTLPEDPQSIIKPRRVSEENIRVLRIDDKPAILAALDQKIKLDSISKLDNQPHPLIEYS